MLGQNPLGPWPHQDLEDMRGSPTGAQNTLPRPLCHVDPDGQFSPFPGVLMGCTPNVLQARQPSASHQVCENYSPAWGVGEAHERQVVA